ncbi:DUF1573 domain-containing protein [Tissierella sp. MSJ-40]|uniref:DUF1573 domain-containing protein n=1 Tax=Tissierella simiarum TaxID=2841534 RepID=A0ABS6E6Y8_9FIRM|nr:DUF1573 domain-containing protein [Tissierella simiarum]MBU5438680.1 DUF1573 domain-containing protein [Tissierella simiarum]
MDRNIMDVDRDSICKDFQKQVSEVLVRHRSVLDIMTKLDEYNSRINRAVAKSVTSCGCISINASKQDYSKESFEEMLDSVKTHVEGSICEGCRDVVEEEMGSYVFYLAALCNTLELDFYEIMSKEYDRIKTLGVFSLK